MNIYHLFAFTSKYFTRPIILIEGCSVQRFNLSKEPDSHFLDAILCVFY